MEAAGCRFDSVVSTTDVMQAHRITSLIGMDALASALQGVSSKFHNLTPLKHAEKFARSTDPVTHLGATRVFVTCGAHVSLASCASSVAALLASVDYAHERTFVGYATESQIQALAAHPHVSRGHEMNRPQVAMQEARLATYVDYLQDYDISDFPTCPDA